MCCTTLILRQPKNEQYHWFIQQGRNNLLSEIYKLPDLKKQKGKGIL